MNLREVTPHPLVAGDRAELKRGERVPKYINRGGFLEAVSHVWLVANGRICGCYSYAYIHDERRATTVGQADDPEAKGDP